MSCLVDTKVSEADKLEADVKSIFIKWFPKLLTIANPNIIFVNKENQPSTVIAGMVGISNWQIKDDSLISDTIQNLHTSISGHAGGAPWISPKFVLSKYKDAIIVLYGNGTKHSNIITITTFINGKIEGFVFEIDDALQQIYEYPTIRFKEYHNDKPEGPSVVLKANTFPNEPNIKGEVLRNGYYSNGVKNGIFTKLLGKSLITNYWIDGIKVDSKSYNKYQAKIKLQIDQYTSLYPDVATIVNSYL